MFAPPAPAPVPAVQDDLAVAVYTNMVRARAAAEGAGGAEAVVVGAVSAMHEDDWVFPGEHAAAAALWRGMPLETCARKARRSFDWRPARIVGASPLPGRHIAHAVGAAWAARMRRSGGVTLAVFPVEATSSGDFHAGLNFAGVARAPIVAVCIVPGGPGVVTKQTASHGVSIKAVAYGLRGVRVDGGDAIAVHGAVGEARAAASSGSGGTLVEAVLPAERHVPGSAGASTPGADGDPFERLRRHLESRGLWSADREASLASQARAEVEQARRGASADEALSGPPGSFFDHVYAEPPWHLREQRARLAPR
jgi:2-oxoisovalerate dehydrogenase E1 component alpha subunit